MESDKRRFVRKRTDQLLYAEFGPDNGSVLLNLCEDGCSFQSMAPVREDQLRFSVSVGDGRKLEGDGQMVWCDTAKKMGGLRFLNPSQELREQVREWLDETLVTAEGKLDPEAVEKRQFDLRRGEERVGPEGSPSDGTPEGGSRLGGNNKALLGATTSNTTAASTTPSLLGKIRTGQEGSRILPRAAANPAKAWRGVGAIALWAALLVTAIGYRREIGHVMMSLGSSIAGDEQKRPGSTGAAEVKESRVVQPVLGVTGDNMAARSGPDAASGTSFEPAAPEDNATVDTTGGVERHSSQPQTAEDEDVPALWFSVENGDTRAEVILANHYIHGEGVPQSCAQGRVLLEAAAKRGNAEAKQQLDRLPQSGCR